MISMEQAKKGLRNYIDHEFTSRVDGLKKWMVAISVEPLVQEMERMFMDNRDILVRTGYMDTDDRINDDRIFDEMMEIARNTGPIIDSMPFLGEITFCDEDVKKLHKYIG